MGLIFSKGKNRYNIAFSIYLIIICLLLVWNLLHCTTYSWDVQQVPFQETSGVSPDEEGRFEIRDGVELAVRFDAWGAQGIREGTELYGAALLNYDNKNSLKFGDEKLKAVLLRESGETAAEAELPLIRQTSYLNDETLLYFSFDPSDTKNIEKQEKLELRIRSEGLPRNGVFFGTDTMEEGQKAVVRIYYRKKAFSPFLSLFYFVLEILIGLAGLRMCYGRKTPLFSGFSEKNPKNPSINNTADNTADNTAASRSGQAPVFSAGNAAAFIVLLIFIAFTFVNVIRPMSVSYSAEVLCSTESAKKSVTLSAGDSVRQQFTCGQNMLGGLGLLFEEEKESADGTEQGSPRLVWRVCEGEEDGEKGETGEKGQKVLASGEGTLDSLSSMKGKLGHDSQADEVLDVSGKALWLSLDNPVSSSAGRTFYLELINEGPAAVEIKATSKTNAVIMVNGEAKERELCLFAGYRNNGFIKGEFFCLCAAVVLIFVLLFVLFAAKNPSAQAMYLAAALSLGLIFSFITPVYTISDERTHIDSIYMMSNDLLGKGDLPGPEKLRKRTGDIDMSIANTMPVTAARYRAVTEGLFKGYKDSDDGTKTAVGYARTALENVTVFNYLPAVAGFTLGRLAGRNLITMIMLARWMNLLACAAVTCAAIRRTPIGKSCIAMIGLFPKTLQETASCSYDGMLIAGTCFFIACFLRVLENVRRGRENSVSDAILLVYSGCFVAANKAGTYLPITALVLMLPFYFCLSNGNRDSGKQKIADSRKSRNSRKYRESRESRKSAADQKNGELQESSAALKTGITHKTGETQRSSVNQRKGAAQKVCVIQIILLMAGFCSVFAAKSLVRVFEMLSRASGAETISSGTKTLYSIADFIHSPGTLVRLMVDTLRIRGDGMLGELVGKNLCQRWVFVFVFLFLAFLGILDEKRKQPEAFSAKDSSGQGSSVRDSSAQGSSVRDSSARAAARAKGRIPEGQSTLHAPADIEKAGNAEEGNVSADTAEVRNLVEEKACSREESLSISPGGWFWILFLIGSGTFLIFLSMLIGFTEKGAGYVDGLQGRYFLPYAPLVFLLLRTKKIVRDGLPDILIIRAGLFLVLLTFFEILCTYFHVW